MPGVPLSLPEREEISVALIEDRMMPWAVIGRRVGRHRTTIARGVIEQGSRHGLRPAVAQQAAQDAFARPRECCLAEDGPLRDRIAGELRLGRSPYAIWAVMAAEGVAGWPCVEMIYTAVYTGIVGVKASECLRSRRPRQRHRQVRHPNLRAGLSNIAARPKTVNDRSELGHREADQIIGRANGSSMLWLTERVPRYSMPVTMPCGYSAEAVLTGLVEGREQIPAHMLRSIAFDHGSDWAEWETLAVTYNISC